MCVWRKSVTSRRYETHGLSSELFFFCFSHILYIWTWSPAIPSAQHIFKVYHPRDDADAVVRADFVNGLEGAHSQSLSVSSLVFSKTAHTVRA